MQRQKNCDAKMWDWLVFSNRGSIRTGGNTYFPFRDLSDGGAISTATSLLLKDLKLRGCIGGPNANQRDRLSFVSVDYQIYETQRQGLYWRWDC